MNSTFARRLLAGLSALLLSSAMPGGAQTLSSDPQSVTTIYVPSGQSATVAVAGVTRLAIGDSQIAGVLMAANGQVLINGKTHGETTLFVWQGITRRTYLVEVTQQSLDEYARVVRNAINEPHVLVGVAKNAIVVSGTVSDPTQFGRVNDVVARFAELAKGEHFTVVNAVTITEQLGSLQKQLGKLPGLERVNVDLDGKGNVVVSGMVRDRQAAELALQRAGGLAGAYLAADGKVIDRMTTDKTTQIGVKVYILEIDDTGLTQLGMSLQGANPDPANPGSFVYGNPTFIGLENAPASALNVAPFARVTRLAPTLDLIIQSGHAKILSEPNLVTSPGTEAKFLVGGEIPYAFATGLGQVSIVFKEYGVKLDMTPKVLGNGCIETTIAPEVSDLDFQNGITLNGFVVPALKTSKLSTDMITQPGESVVMGGLLRRLQQRTISRMPILGDLPILGPLFRSTRYQNNQTDVVFVMTPEAIVR
ncbi:MAG: pilus assembly protein N-terminal domain-containing protein [Candidatus Velthaea sp.]